jgi:hypothetical protein
MARLGRSQGRFGRSIHICIYIYIYSLYIYIYAYGLIRQKNPCSQQWGDVDDDACTEGNLPPASSYTDRVATMGRLCFLTHRVEKIAVGRWTGLAQTASTFGSVSFFYDGLEPLVARVRQIAKYDKPGAVPNPGVFVEPDASNDKFQVDNSVRWTMFAAFVGDKWCCVVGSYLTCVFNQPLRDLLMYVFLHSEGNTTGPNVNMYYA